MREKIKKGPHTSCSLSAQAEIRRQLQRQQALYISRGRNFTQQLLLRLPAVAQALLPVRFLLQLHALKARSGDATRLYPHPVFSRAAHGWL
jgi:hypothetical protein